jgi:tyrosine-protein kinase Etk/Wzc
MSTLQPQDTTLSSPANVKGAVDVNEIIKKYLYHWPLYIVGIILAMVLAYFYLLKTNPVYPIVATLKFDVPTLSSSGGGPMPQSALMQSLDPTSKPVIVENEIEVMQSEKLMYQVVMNLQLWVTYTQKSHFLTKDLYKISPFDFKFLKQNGTLPPNGVAIKVFIKDHNSFIVKDIDGKIQGDKKFVFSAPVKNDFGTWQLSPTPNLENYIDSTIVVNVEDPDLAAAGLQKGIKAELEDKDAPFVNLSTTDIVPQRGKDILNAVLDLYQKEALGDKTKEAQRALVFIDKRLDSVGNDLKAVENKIQQYQSSEGITDLVAQAQSDRDVNQANTKSLNDAKLQQTILQELEIYANSPKNDQKLPAIDAAFLDVSLVSIYEKLSDLELQREQLLATTPTENPIYIPIDRQIAALKSSIKDKVIAIKSALQASQKQLESINSGYQTSLKKIPMQGMKSNAMKREEEIKAALYSDLLTLRERVSLQYGSSVSDAQIVDDAHAGKVKWPMVPMVYGLAFILGLILPTSLVYAREMLNDRIISRKQIEDATGVPILGEISYLDSKSPIVVTGTRSKFAIGEQFRVLRTNLYHLHNHNGKGRVTLCTSSIGGEGKSFICSNIAVTMAYTSRKVILLEMDLRKPKVSINFGLSSEHPGISEYLENDSLGLEGLIQHSNIPGLDILSCGLIVPNPSELLEKRRLDDLINELKKVYDDIVIDSPPIHLVTDAIIISRTADVSLYVARQGYTYKHEIEFIAEINADNRFPKLTVIFNGVKSGKHGYGYSYSDKSYNSYNTSKEKLKFGSVIKGFFRRF